MSTLFFIRHGQASFGKENYDALSAKGKTQAYLMGTYFRRINITFDAVYSGTLLRHEQTEQEIRKAYCEDNFILPSVQKIEELNEYDSHAILKVLVPELIEERVVSDSDVAGIFTNRKSFQRVFEAAMLKWVSGEYRGTISSWRDFVERVYRALETIMRTDGRGKVVAVITSGGPISAVVKRALSLSDENAMRVTWQIKNASFSRFKCTSDAIMLESFNEVPHLEDAGAEMITYR